MLKPLLTSFFHSFPTNRQICSPLPPLKEVQDRVKNSLKVFRQDHLRGLNPTPYKVYFTFVKLYCFPQI